MDRLIFDSHAHYDDEAFDPDRGEILRNLPAQGICRIEMCIRDRYSAWKANPCVTLLAGEEPVQLLKGVKNDVEIENIKNAHVKDGVAMVRFQMALEDKMANGDPLTECDVADMLSALRREQPLSLGAVSYTHLWRTHHTDDEYAKGGRGYAD